MSFQNIKLLECNREQSAEKNNDSDNNAIFTNRMGEVVELNPGDEISLQSAFINKRGTANLNSIEFKGKSLGVTGKFRQSSTAKENPLTYSINNKYKEVLVYTDYTSQATPTQNNTPQGNVAFRQIYNEDIVKDLRDNELNLETVFYKTTNGENYAIMPKNYLRTDFDELNNNVKSGKVHDYPLLNVNTFWASQYFNRCDNDIDIFNYSVEKSGGDPLEIKIYMKGIMSGVSRYAPNTFIGYGQQMGINNYIDSFCSADYRRVQQIVGYGTWDTTNPGTPAPKNPPSDPTYFGQSYIAQQPTVVIASSRKVSDFVPADGQANPVVNVNLERILNNYYEDIRGVQENERFTLFEREFDFMMYINQPATPSDPPIPNIPFINSNNQPDPVYMDIWWRNTRYKEPAGQTPLPVGFPKRFVRLHMRSPALYPYLKRSKVNTITLNKGYSTPQSIAEQISEQLQKQDTDSPYIYDRAINRDPTFKGSPNYGNNLQTPAYTTAFQTRFFEPIICANRHKFSFDTYDSFFSDTIVKDGLSVVKINPGGGGSGFTDGTHTDVNIAGASGGSGARASVIVSNNAILSVIINTGENGTGYKIGEKVTLSLGTPGIGAGTGTDIIVNNVVSSGYNSKLAFLWWNSFHNMYFKRPELYEAGTKVNDAMGFVLDAEHQANPTIENPGLYDSLTNEEIDSTLLGNFILNDISYDRTNNLNNNTKDPIVTSWLYTKQNLDNLQNLFDEQGKHPELFYDETKDASWNYPFMNKTSPTTYSDRNATINNSRFLHINRFYFNEGFTGVPETFDGGNGFNALGDDGFCQFTYETTGSTPSDTRTFDCDHRSVPFFFRYDIGNRNTDTGGDNINNLSYGFATKTRRNDEKGVSRDYITLHPEFVNGLRADVFNMRGGQKPFTQSDTTKFTDVAEWEPGDIFGLRETLTSEITLIGWDRHFTSWGNMAIMETTGQAPVSYDGLASPSSIGQGIPYTASLTGAGGTITTVDYYDNDKGAWLLPGSHAGITGYTMTPDPVNGSPDIPSTGSGALFTVVIGADKKASSIELSNDGGKNYKKGDYLFLYGIPEYSPLSMGDIPEQPIMKITGTKSEMLASNNFFLEMAYAGTNNIACVYDQVSNKFGFEYLHMPEFVGNEYDAGVTDYITQGDEQDVASYNIPIDDDAGNEVYKINKRLRKMAFCPDMTPYMDMTGVIESQYQPTSGTPGQVRVDPMNNGFSPWIIYDSKGGVAINFGQSAKIDEDISPISQSEAWNNSVLGILGFSYEQFNPDVITSKNTYQGRLTGNNINSVYFPTTNGELLTADTNTYYMNPFGAVLYTNQLPTCLDLQLSTTSTFNEGDGSKVTWHFLPSIVKPTKSMKLEGVNLPRVTLNPYMTIRSDLVTHNKYIGGVNSGLSLPIIGIVQKINADKDYLETAIGEVFTVTEPMKFSSITTAICDPDGSLSLLDQGSAVIYKIAKNDNINNYSFLEDFKKNLKK